MSEEEIIKDIKETNYNEKDVEKLLYELENDSGDYSCYDIAIAIIYYKDLYNKEKEKNKELEEKLKAKKYMLNAETGEVKEIPIDDNYISKDKIRDLIAERKFELQQEYEDFENDIKLKILKELLEE